MRLTRTAAVLRAWAESGLLTHQQIGGNRGALDLSGAVWIVDRIITDPKEYRRARKLLWREELSRRRHQHEWANNTARYDIHGQHRTIVIAYAHFSLGDWRYQPMYDTIKLGDA